MQVIILTSKTIISEYVDIPAADGANWLAELMLSAQWGMIFCKFT